MAREKVLVRHTWVPGGLNLRQYHRVNFLVERRRNDRDESGAACGDNAGLHQVVLYGLPLPVIANNNGAPLICKMTVRMLP